MGTTLRFTGYPNKGHCSSERQLEVNRSLAEVAFFQIVILENGPGKQRNSIMVMVITSVRGNYQIDSVG